MPVAASRSMLGVCAICALYEPRSGRMSSTTMKSTPFLAAKAFFTIGATVAAASKTAVAPEWWSMLVVSTTLPRRREPCCNPATFVQITNPWLARRPAREGATSIRTLQAPCRRSGARSLYTTAYTEDRPSHALII
jgi:hypothetical protein